jgi:hypothetical protein
VSSGLRVATTVGSSARVRASTARYIPTTGLVPLQRSLREVRSAFIPDIWTPVAQQIGVQIEIEA